MIWFLVLMLGGVGSHPGILIPQELTAEQCQVLKEKLDAGNYNEPKCVPASEADNYERAW